MIASLLTVVGALTMGAVFAAGATAAMTCWLLSDWWCE